MRWAIVASLDRKARAISSAVGPPTTRKVSAARASGDRMGWQAVKIRPSNSSPRSPSMAASIAWIAWVAPSNASSSVRAIASCLRSRILSRRKASMARRLARASSQAPGIGRNADPRPFGQGDDQRVLRQLLGKVDIPHHAGQARDEPGPFNAKGRFDHLVRLACGHTSFSAKAPEGA
jgi:hypothetical protein